MPPSGQAAGGAAAGEEKRLTATIRDWDQREEGGEGAFVKSMGRGPVQAPSSTGSAESGALFLTERRARRVRAPSAGGSALSAFAARARDVSAVSAGTTCGQRAAGGG